MHRDTQWETVSIFGGAGYVMIISPARSQSQFRLSQIRNGTDITLEELPPASITYRVAVYSPAGHSEETGIRKEVDPLVTPDRSLFAHSR